MGAKRRLRRAKGRWSPLILMGVIATSLYMTDRDVLPQIAIESSPSESRSITSKQRIEQYTNGGVRVVIRADPMKEIMKNHQVGSSGSRIADHPTCLIVYHVPKTGGTTLELYLRYLAEALGWKLQTWDATARKHGNRTPVKFRRDKLIHEGHLTPGFENLTETHDCAKFTVLRDPIDRVISAFYFHNRNDHSDEEFRRCLYQSCDLQFEYLNDVVRRFANPSGWWHSFDKDRYVVGTLPQDLDEGSLTVAQQRLESMSAVCLLQEVKGCFERFVLKTFGIEFALPDLELNAGKLKRDHKEVDNALRMEIAQANALDVRLYEWVLRRFAIQHNATIQ